MPDAQPPAAAQLDPTGNLGALFTRVVLIIFLLFHLLVMAFFFQNLSVVETADAVMKECGLAPMERETRRYQLFAYYNNADTSLWEYVINFAWLILVLVLLVTLVFATQGKIVVGFKLGFLMVLATIFLVVDLYLVKTRFKFNITNLFRSFSMPVVKSECDSSDMLLLQGLGGTAGANEDLSLSAATSGLSVYYRDLTNKIRDVIECSPSPSSTRGAGSGCPYDMPLRLKKALIKRIMVSDAGYVSPDEAALRLAKMIKDREFYKLVSYLKLQEQQTDLKDLRISAHELQDLTFADPYDALKSRIQTLLAISYVPIVVLIYVWVVHPRFARYRN